MTGMAQCARVHTAGARKDQVPNQGRLGLDLCRDDFRPTASEGRGQVKFKLNNPLGKSPFNHAHGGWCQAQRSMSQSTKPA